MSTNRSKRTYRVVVPIPGGGGYASYDTVGLTAGANITLTNVVTDGRASVAVAAAGGGGAPTTADYLVKTADAGLSAERVVTDTTEIAIDWGTAGQAKFGLVATTVAAGSKGSATKAPIVTVDAKGRLTALTDVTINPATSNLLSVNTSVPAGNTVANTTSATAFTSSLTIPANTLASGMLLRIKLAGHYSTILTPTLTGQIKLGSTVIATTGAVTLGTAASGLGWEAECDIVVFTDGAGGTLDVQTIYEFATAAGVSMTVNSPNTATVAIDTTASNVLTFVVTWGTASASNTITLRQATAELGVVNVPSSVAVGGDCSGTVGNISVNATTGIPKLTSLVGLTWAANKFAYFTGAATAAISDMTASALTLLALTATAGDTLYSSGAGVWARLAANATGTAKQLTQVSGGAPSWVDSVLSGDSSGTLTACVNTIARGLRDAAAVSWANTGTWANGQTLMLSGGNLIAGCPIAGLYGDGSDSALAYDGVATILGMAPVANVYTLTRDILATSITISAGVTIKPAGYTIYCTGTLTFTDATSIISNDGNAAAGTVGGTHSSGLGSIAYGASAGANGRTSSGNGAAAISSSNSVGGAGGAGGAGGTGLAGAATSAAAPAASQGAWRTLSFLLRNCRLISSTSLALIGAGVGGSAGGAQIVTGTVNSGGGGAGGGVVAIIARIIVGAGTVRALGGAGGVATVTLTSIAGGGGGGGGGIVAIATSTVSLPCTVSVAAGALGAGAGGGASGNNGSVGVSLQFAA